MRANPVVIKATDPLAVRMAPRLRLVDCLEIRDHADPLAVIRQSLAGASHAWAWMIDGEPACIFGVSPRSLVGGTAFAWFLATDAIATDLRTFLLGSREMVRMMQGLYPRIEGMVDARYTQSVRWIRRLGFQFGDTIAHNGIPVLTFTLERGQ